jgi:hypothetical protein
MIESEQSGVYRPMVDGPNIRLFANGKDGWALLDDAGRIFVFQRLPHTSMSFLTDIADRTWANCLTPQCGIGMPFKPAKEAT